ncbi:MAG: hypothetical protein JNK68_04670 [Betaproteobacteria bacterium]|nr:hypothetical protein [Betaproteobacteria bacterium]
MDKRTIESRLRAAVRRRLGTGRECAVTSNSRFADLGIDSLDVMDVLFEAEEEYGIRFTDRAARAFVTIGDVAAYIAGRQAQTA